MEKYYVYVYRDPRPETGYVPIYVGKGCRRRASLHIRRAGRSKINNIHLQRFILARRREGILTSFEIDKIFDVEKDAFDYEKKLIRIYGRRDLGTGTLFNNTDGGEGVSGISEKNRSDKSNRMRAWRNSPEVALATVERTRSMHKDLEFAKSRDKRLQELNSNIEFMKIHHERASVRLSNLHKDPVFAENHSRRMKLQHLAKNTVDSQVKENCLKEIEEMKRQTKLRRMSPNLVAKRAAVRIARRAARKLRQSQPKVEHTL
jgi:hypothetical protein